MDSETPKIPETMTDGAQIDPRPLDDATYRDVEKELRRALRYFEGLGEPLCPVKRREYRRSRHLADR